MYEYECNLYAKAKLVLEHHNYCSVQSLIVYQSKRILCFRLLSRRSKPALLSMAKYKLVRFIYVLYIYSPMQYA